MQFFRFPAKRFLASSLIFPVAIMAATALAETDFAETDKDALQLDTVVVKADAEKTGTDPVNGYKAEISATGTKTDTPLIDTPAAVQVISRDVMDDQRVLSIGDAVKNVSGVFQSHAPDGNTMDSFNIRGFDVAAYGATYLDGTKDFSRSPGETAGLERIEVLKGPAAIMYGRIEPGGLINRVSKRPQAESLTTVEQQIGSYNFYRTTVDSTGAVTDDKELLYRVNVVYEDTDGYKDYTHNRRRYIAPQVSWQPTEDTAVRAGLQYQNDDNSWALGYGTIGDDFGPVNVDIDTNLNGKDDYYTDENTTSFVEWSHDLNSEWRLQQRISYTARNSVARGSGLSEADNSGNYTRDYWGWEDEQEDALSTNIEMLGKIETGAIKHTILFGTDYFNEDYNSGGWAYGGTAMPSNVHHPVYDEPYDQDYTIEDFWFSNRNLGAYLQDQMSMLDDRLHILIGTRYDDSEYRYTWSNSHFTANDDMPTWRGGVLYKLQPDWSVYGSYVEGFGLSNFDWSTGSTFDPQTSHQYEVGTKWDITPDLGFTVAVFQLVKDNLTMGDPLDPTVTVLAGEATSKGIELDLNGEIAPGWNIIASYAYTDVKYTNSDTMQGERLYNVPRHGASLWSSYEIPDTGFEVGAGAVYRSSRLGVQRHDYPTLYPYMMEGYTTVDAMVSYSFPLAQQEAKVQLNISNLTNEEYFPASYGDKSRIAQGEPRMIVGSIQLSF